MTFAQRGIALRKDKEKQGSPSPLRPCRKGGKMKNVMLNLFQHLIESNTYETLK